MATAAKKTAPAAKGKPAETPASNLPATKPTTAVAEVQDTDMFAADAGAGMEEATADSYAMPFLLILQKMSPQVDENDGAYIDGAKAGMIMQNVTNELYDGKDGILFQPVYFKREFIRWGAREGGSGGFKGVLNEQQVQELRVTGKLVELEGGLFFPLDDGSVNPKKCDRVSDHRSHYGNLLTADGPRPCLLSLTSTQIKKSKQLMSALANVRINTPQGLVQPAAFANKVRLTTQLEQNDKGNWFGLRVALDGFVDKDTYAAGKALYNTVKSGKVEVKYEEQAGHGGSGGGGGSRDNSDDQPF